MKKRILSTTLLTLVVLFAVPLSVWGDDVVVSTGTTWTFPTSGSVDVVTAQQTNGSDNGLYYRAGSASARNISFSAGANLTWEFTDGHNISVTTATGCASLLANNDIDPTCNSASSGIGTALSGNADNRALAFTTGKAGKVYIAFRATGNTAGRTYKLFFKPSGESSYTTVVTTDDAATISNAADKKGFVYYEAKSGGTFVFGGGEKSNVYAIEFVPETVSNPTFNTSTAGSATITSGTSTLTGSGNYEIKTYYKTSASSGETFTKDDGTWTEGTSVSLNSGGYVYAYSKNTVTGVTSDIVSGQITANIVNYTLTLGSVSNGTISATVDGTSVSSGANVESGKTVTLTATPSSGYQLSEWTDGSNSLGTMSKSLVNTFTMNAATTVNATFEALPTLTGVTEESVWTFDSFVANTLLSDKIVYGYTNATGNTLYINGHDSGGSNQATIKSGNSTVTGISDEVTNYLYFYGSQDSDLKHNRKANAFTKDVASLKTESAGIISVYAKGPNSKNINIYEAINSTPNSGSTNANKYTTATTGSAQLVTQYVSKNADVFISCSGSPLQIYAVKYTPETVGTPSVSQEGNTVTITTGASNASLYGATVNTYYTTDGTEPTSNSIEYTGSFDVTEACTVKAITISSGGSSSAVVSQECTYTPAVINSSVTFESAFTGGSITVKSGDETVASASEIASGTTLTVIVTPSNGYALGSLSITKTSNSETITPTQDQEDATKYTFTMPTEAVSISATFTIPVWTVNNQANGDITTKTAVDNVYLHQKSGRKSTVADAGTQTLTQFTNGTVHGAIKKLTIQGAAEYSSQTGVTTDYISNAMTNRNTADADIDRDFLALDVTEAGILYVIYKPNDNTDTRNVYVGFQKASDNSYTKTIQSASIGKVQTEIKHSANGAGTFFIYSSIATEIYAIMFVPETVKILTTVASPADGGIIKVTNGNATYEGAANGLAVESNTELALVATANTGYNFTGWSENVTSGSVTMDGDKTVTANFEAITYPLTITQPETGGSITATVDETSYSESTNVLENKTVTLSAAPADGYQLVGWTDGTNALGDLPKSLVNTITMTAAKTATATFEAIPTVAGVTEESVWTFDDFAANTILSDKTVYGYNNGKGTLYISGHSKDGSITAAAKVVAGNMTEGQVVGTGVAIQPEKCLQLQGGGISSLAVSRTANSFTPDAIAFQAGVPGTVYVLMSGGYKTGETRSINIAANKSETDNTKKAIYSTILTEGDPVQVVSCEIAEASSVFIGTSGGGKNIYAVKFVPAPTYAVTIPAVEHGSAEADKTNAAAGETVTLTVTPATGYMVDKVIVKNGEADIDVTTVTENQTYSFVMPAAAPTITVSFKENHTKIWDFSDWNADDEITTVTKKNGLYYRGGTDTRKLTVSANTSTLTWNFPDGFAYQRSSSAGGNNLILKGNGNLNIAGTLTPDAEADNTNNLTLAFTTTEAGTVYVAYRIASGKNANLYYKSSTGENYDVVATGSADDNNNRQGVLFYTAPSGGTFFIGGNGDMNVYLVKFEPAETVYTLTETANPTEGGSVKKEIVYGDANSPSYYEAISNTFLSGTKLRLTPAPAVGYGFSYWGDTTTDTDASKTITMDADQSVKVNFTEVKHQITVASAENGTVGLQVGGESVTLTDGKANIGEGAEVTVVATPTLFYSVKDIKVTKTGDVNTTVEVTNGKFTLPAYDVTVTATFEAEKKYDATTAKEWTFGSAGETVNSVVDLGDGLYLRGSSRTFTKVETGVSSVTFGDETITDITSALQTSATFNAPDAGNTSATAISFVNSASATPMIAVNAASQGTVYIAASPVADGNGQIRIYFSDGTGVPTQMVNPSIPSKDEVYTASYATDVPGTFYLGTTVAANIYAVKFVPTVTYAVSKSEMTNGDVTIEPVSASAGQTVTLTVVPADNYRLKSGTLKATYNDGTEQTLPIENNQFTMPAYAVTVSAEFEAIPAVYGTYDFRTWAEANISDKDQTVVVRDGSGVLTGEFTPVEEGVTVGGTMPLNGVFSIVGTKDDNIANYKLRKNGTTGDAGSGLLFPRCSVGQADFIISNLQAGDWFTVATHTNHLIFAEANEYITPLGSETAISASDELIPGRVYKVKDSATSRVSVKLCNAISGGGVSYIYSVTISKDEAISEPVISDLTDGKVAITDGSSTIGGSVKTYYTIDGSVPTASSPVYTEAVAIDQTRIVKAVTINTTTNVVSNVVTKKIVVDAATPATTWDFVNDATLSPLTYADETYNGYYINSSGAAKGDGKFKYVTNEKIHAKLSWQLEGTETANASVGENGLSITKGGRAFAINDLHVGDKIFITYTNTGETPLKTSINENHGCSISADGGETVASGNTTEIASGAEIEIKSAPEGYEYLVLMPADNQITIQKIEINPSFTVTNLTASDSGVTGVKVIKVDDKTVDETFASEETKSFIRGSKVTLQASYTAETGKSLLWLDAEDNELEANADGTLTLTVDADLKVKALYTTGITVTEVKNAENKMVARKLNNGLLEVTFDNNGRITAIKDVKSGKEVMASDDNNQRGYFNFNYRPSKDANVIDFGLECNSSGDIVQIGKSGSQQVELIYPTADAATPSHQTWKIGYVMKAGVSGIYTYAIMDGSSSYSELHEARYGWRVNPDIFNYAWVSDSQKGKMPTPTQMKNYVEEVQDATYKLDDGTIYTKYDWANFVKDDQLHGIMGDGIGAWLISPSAEWVNGGPQKQELTVHATDTTPIILQTMHSRHFGAGEAVLESSDDKKLFGPCLFYVNTGASQDAMIQDAKSKAAEEVGAWPYSWFTNNADIKSGLVKNESDRGGVTGKVNIDSRFRTEKVQVVLTQGNMKPLLDANGYQYYAEAAVGSNFELKNVRPGTYTLYVYALDGGATGTYSQTDVTVSAGESIDLGAIEWPTDGVGKILWRVGNADKSTKGFKLSDEQRQYGKWQSVPETLTYTVGTSSEANDWYYAQVKNDGTWNIKFNSEESIASPLRLTIATAGASQTPKLEIKMNDNLLNSSSIALTNDAAIYRSGILGGRDSLIVLEVPAGYVQKGENTLSLKVWNLGTSVGGVMYDCIKLETLEAQPQLWDFSEWDAATKKELGVVTESKGLYYRSGTGGRSISLNKYNINAMTWNFPDGFAYSREKNEGNYALLPGNGALAPAADLTPATQLGTELKNTDDSNNRTLAFTTYGAGTVYVAYRGTAEKDYKLFFKAAGGDSYQPVVINQVDANDSNKGLLFYTAAEGGSFLLGGAANMNVYMIKFEPAETIYKLTAAVDPEDAGTIQKELVYTVGEEEKTYAATEYATAFLPKTKLALTAEANKGYKFAKWSDNTTAASTTVTMDADKTVTASFEEVSFEVDVYGVYDFRTFATENITFAEGVTDAQALPVVEEGVMTGAFTLDETKGTVAANTMELKDAFTVTDASNRIKLRKNSNTASTGLLMQENSSNSSMGINYLKNGDWFKIDLSGTLYFKNSYAKVKKFRGEASVQAGDAVESGAIYMISGNSTVELYNMDGGNAHIYSITISNEEFVSDPTIELKDVQGETAIYTLTFDEGSTLHYQLSTETEEQQGGTTGSYDLNITEGAKLTAWATRGAVTSGKLEVNVYAPTPAPSEEGTFDFGEASAELPADIEVALDNKNAIVINGENFYKPTALTAATFDDKFAFSETSTDDKIKIRTNRQLTFAKGADMDMAVLNVEKGDIIAMDYTGGTIEFSASDIVTTDQSELQNASRRAVAENQALESGETYVATGDGNIVLHLRLTSSAVNISKMVLTKVGEPTAPKALDFVNAMDNEEALETGNTVSVYVNGSNSASQFVRLANESEDLPFDGQISTQSGRGSLTTGGLKMDKNRFAIHGLALGDKILIRFYGGELTLQTNETKGSSVSVESTGVKLQPGDALESGVVITVDKVDYLNNYIVLQGDGSCIISGIFINHDEVERIIAPSLRDRDNGLIQITPGRSTTGGEVFTCYTTDGTEPSMTNGTMGLMTEMFEVELRELYECDVTLKVVSFSRDGAMSKVVEMTVHVSGVITGIDGVPTIDGKAVDIFDMSGRKVQTMKKGQIYIIDGKKYLYK